MTSDLMEAESLRYSRAAFFVLPLSSGRIAILRPNRQLHCIVDDWEQAKEHGVTAEQTRPVTAVREPVVIDLDLDL